MTVKPCLTALLCLALVVAFAMPAGAADPTDRPGASAAACDTIRLGGQTYVFYRTRVTCRFGKRWARNLYRTRGEKRPRNWTCASGSRFREGGQCHRGNGRRIFGWQPGD